MANMVSALNGHYKPGNFDHTPGHETDLYLAEVQITKLMQVACWRSSFNDVAGILSAHTHIGAAPSANQFAATDQVTVLRSEPLKWLLLGHSDISLNSEQGATLDLSHARTHLRISGKVAREFLNRHIPLDLREHKFKPGDMATTVCETIDVTIWRSEQHYNLLIARSFARHFWKLILQSAMQYNHRIEPMHTA